MDKDTLFYKKRTIRCNHKILELNIPLIMGILNVTPDSFYDGGRYTSEKEIIDRVGKMLKEGANIIDIGGYSSRPGALDTPLKEELDRVRATLDIVRGKFPDSTISIDTFRADVARMAIEAYNVDIINDISAGNADPEILDIVAENKTAYIAMHMKGTPRDMQVNPQYTNVLKEIIEYFAPHIEKLLQKGINDLIIDPGFGFGKTLEHNYQIIAGLDCFNMFEFPVMVGLSRKSMIYKYLNTNAAQALTGTIALNLIALQKGASILRVHDVLEARQTIDIYEKIQIESKKSFNLLNNEG